jgi:hypothetical protein
MPAIDYTLVKRSNFASREPGVVLVFCILGAIALLIIGFYTHKRLVAKREAEALQPTTPAPGRKGQGNT